MIKKYLGDTIDIHGGGQDLIFPHHENEIAQSEAANGCPFANCWVHNAFVNVDGEKMSKSLGNFFTIRDIVAHFPYQVIRFFILSGHYRMPINFSDELLRSAQNGLDRIVTCANNLRFVIGKNSGDGSEDELLLSQINTAGDEFIKVMDDDLNTADAITVIFNLVRDINTAVASGNVSDDALKAALDKLVELTGVLGIETEAEDDGIPSEIMELVEQRTAAKKNKDYAEADRIRDLITSKGYSVKDTPQGPQVEKL